MKIAFDEHVPDGLVRVFESLTAERKMRRVIGANGRGQEGGYEIVTSRSFNALPGDDDYIKGKGSDAPWINKFAASGGTVIISGNVDMMSVPQEVIALQQAGMITFYFEGKWNLWNFFKKSALLLWHWELIIRTVQNGSPGDVYRIPVAFSDVAKLNLISKARQLEMLVEAPHHATKGLRKVRKRVSTKRVPPKEQGNLEIEV